jgi:hypothetical protein
MLHAQLAALALVTISLAASGCDGSSKSKTTSTAAAATTTSTTAATTTATTPSITVTAPTGKPLTRAQLIARADTICAGTNQKLSTISVVDKNEFARVLPQVAIYFSGETNELSKLAPPKSMTQGWTQLLSDFRLYSEYTNTVAKYAQVNNFHSAAPLIHDAEELHQKLVILAKHEGFTHCSRLSND